jgi:sterol carrier protein 2
MATKQRVFVVGVGMTKFEKAGQGQDYPEMGKLACERALHDAKISYKDVKTVIAGYNYGDPTCGQRVVYELGLTGVPICNVNNNCSTGSTALFLARSMILSGQYDCALALGFEKMEKGLTQKFTDSGYTSPVAKHFERTYECGSSRDPLGTMNEMTAGVLKMFGDAALEHQRKYGTTNKHFAMIAYKNHKHSVNNPYAQIQKEFPLDLIENMKPIYGPINAIQSCPTADGAAAAIVCSEKFVHDHGLEDHAVEILSQAMVTDTIESFDKANPSHLNLIGYQMNKQGAARVLSEANLSINDVDVIELHDCFSCHELILYEALGLCKEGEAGKLVESGKWVKNAKGGELFKIGKRWVVNPSGGLESKGHPIGATGLGQCAELCWQLRGEADKRQVKNAKVGLQQNFGLGSTAVITLYRKYKPLQAKL